MYLKKKLLLWTFCLCIHSSYCQEEFAEGFIIKPGQHFIYGYVNSHLSPLTVCLFKESQTDVAIRYTPDQIEGYGLLNKNPFITKTIAIGSVESKYFLETTANGQSRYTPQ
jgi:hypothetical protein